MSNEAPTDALRLVPDGLTFDGNDMTAAADALRPWMKNYPPSTRTERCVEAANAILTTFCLRKNVSALAAAPASPLPGGGTSYAAGGLDVLSRIRSRLNEQIDRAEADLNSTVTIRLNDAKAIRHMLAPAAPTGEPK